MRLKLSIAGKEFASIPLDEKKASSLDYLHAKRRLLMASHSDFIASQKQSPVCYIEVASKMNRRKIPAAKQTTAINF